MKPLTHEQATVLEILIDNTHAFMTPGFVDQVNKAFGTKLTVYRHKADGKRNPKGLTLDNGAQEASGLASFEIAPMLCSALGIAYAESFGRGTQVRQCVEAIRNAAKD